MHINQLQPTTLYDLCISEHLTITAFILDARDKRILVTRFGDYFYDRSIDLCVATASYQFPGKLAADGWIPSRHSPDHLTELISQRWNAQMKLLYSDH